MNLPPPLSQHHLTRYIRFVAPRQNRSTPSGYVERHHILPRSMGGTNDESNLVYLTLREHFIAHRILWRAYRTAELAKAFFLMGGKQDNHTSRDFETARTEWLTDYSANHHSRRPESKARQSVISTAAGKKRAKEGTHHFLSIHRAPWKCEHCGKTGVGLGNYDRWHRNAVCTKPRDVDHSNPFIANNPSSVAWTCEHCGRSGRGTGNYVRWHGIGKCC
jgi:hypothetical protein